MSVKQELDGLPDRIGEYGVQAYLVTVTDEGAPHVVSVTVGQVDGRLAVAVGDRTRANLESRPTATLLWPPADDPAYSLLVDGAYVGDVDEGARITIEPTSAVLHRVSGADGEGPTCLPVS